MHSSTTTSCVQVAAALAQEKAAAAETAAARAATAEAATEAQLSLLTECAVRRPDVLNVRPADLPNTARMREAELVARHWAALARYEVPRGEPPKVLERSQRRAVNTVPTEGTVTRNGHCRSCSRARERRIEPSSVRTLRCSCRDRNTVMGCNHNSLAAAVHQPTRRGRMKA
jgi:hypothetical protein